jgi:hypothetical protein
VTNDKIAHRSHVKLKFRVELKCLVSVRFGLRVSEWKWGSETRWLRSFSCWFNCCCCFAVLPPHADRRHWSRMRLSSDQAELQVTRSVCMQDPHPHMDKSVKWFPQMRLGLEHGVLTFECRTLNVAFQSVAALRSWVKSRPADRLFWRCFPWFP